MKDFIICQMGMRISCQKDIVSKRLKPIIIGFTCSRLIERQTQITVHERKKERHERTIEQTKKKNCMYVKERTIR